VHFVSLKVWPAAHCFHKLSPQTGTHLIRDHNDKIWIAEYLWTCKITDPLSWDTNCSATFQFQNRLEQTCAAGGMPRLKPTDFDAWETVRSVPATSLSRLSQLFVHSRALRRLRANTFRGTKRWSGCTTLVTTVCNDFVRRLPGAHALRAETHFLKVDEQPKSPQNFRKCSHTRY